MKVRNNPHLAVEVIKMGFYSDRKNKTVSGCDCDVWHIFKQILGRKSMSATVNDMVEDFVYRWRSDNAFTQLPLDKQIGEVAQSNVRPFYKNRFVYKNSLDKAA